MNNSTSVNAVKCRNYGKTKVALQRNLVCALICLTISSVFSTVRAEKLALPDQLSEIGDDAFYGNEQIIEVTIPKSVEIIGYRAFAECTALGWITIPSSVKIIGEDAFDNCADDILIRTTIGSEALRFARSNQIDYQANTRYRALLIGQTYEDKKEMKLDGPENDIEEMKSCLEKFRDTPFEVTLQKNLSAAEMEKAINENFIDASSEDVSLFYYSGHGVSSQDANIRGALLGNDGTDCLTADELRSVLDNVPGRKIVIIDACYSGNFITGEKQTSMLKSTITTNNIEYTGEDFASSFISVFSRRKKSNLAGDDYFVITAASDNEESYETDIGGKIMGLFTEAFCNGCGYNCAEEIFCDLKADQNMNHVLTFEEIFKYTRKKMLIENQHVQGYPSECLWFGILRE